MTSIYLVNVGANAGHGSCARSPIFPDQQFIFVSFPTNAAEGTSRYSKEARNFVRRPDNWKTHADPDWLNLTYGDYCANPRAGALKRVLPGDILLFWGMLWTNRDLALGWNGFTGEREWYLLGALRVVHILPGGQHVDMLPKEVRARARSNAHLAGESRLEEGHYIFIGDPGHSCLLRYAIPLATFRDDGLIYRAFTAASGVPLERGGTPAWKSSLRSCRAMWNLNIAEQRGRVRAVASAISECNDFDLLAGC